MNYIYIILWIYEYVMIHDLFYVINNISVSCNSQEQTSQYSTWLGQSLSDFPAFISGRGGRHMISSFTGSVCTCWNNKKKKLNYYPLIANTCLISITLRLNTYWDKVTACSYLHQDNRIARDIRKENIDSKSSTAFYLLF